jgi:hypothetical protein
MGWTKYLLFLLAEHLQDLDVLLFLYVLLALALFLVFAFG